MRTTRVLSVVFLMVFAVSCKKEKAKTTAPPPAAQPEARKEGPPLAHSVPFFRDFRMGMGMAEVKKVAAAYAAKGILSPAMVARKKEGDSSEAGTEEKKPVAGPPNELVALIKAILWEGKKVAVGSSQGRTSRIEFRFDKGKLTKIELDAYGFIPQSFTLAEAKKYLTMFHLNGKYISGESSNPGEMNFRIRDNVYEIEFEYVSAVGHLAIELEFKPAN